MNESLGAIAYVRAKLLGPAQAGQRTADQDALRALVGERVYAGAAPAQDPASQKRPVFPLIVVSIRSATDKTAVAGASVFVSILIDVKVVGTGAYSDLAPIDDLVFRLLQQSGNVLENLEIMGCHREQSLVLEQIDNNATYRTLVQAFRVFVSRIVV